jgi:hypothetical protein
MDQLGIRVAPSGSARTAGPHFVQRCTGNPRAAPFDARTRGYASSFVAQ